MGRAGSLGAEVTQGCGRCSEGEEGPEQAKVVRAEGGRSLHEDSEKVHLSGTSSKEMGLFYFFFSIL